MPFDRGYLPAKCQKLSDARNISFLELFKVPFGEDFFRSILNVNKALFKRPTGGGGDCSSYDLLLMGTVYH